MKEVDVHQVDAFTDQLFGGNPAGVVTNADELTVDEMQKIAREMNVSETAFVLAPTTRESGVKFRFFTPTADEIDFCGHATVGALFQLAELNKFDLGKSGENVINVETGAGILTATITNSDGATKIAFAAPDVDMAPYHLQGEAFARASGISAELVKPGGVVLLDRKLNYIYIPTTSLKLLGKQTFDFERIREQFAEEKIVVFSFFASETFSNGSDLHARGLAPLVGINEDPFTGSMQAGLVAAAKQNGYIATNEKSIITEQGHFIGRPGFAEVNHDVASGQYIITASAVPVFSSRWRI